MAIGTYGISRPADVNVNDISVYYNYTPNRETSNNTIYSLNASEILEYCYLPDDEQDIANYTENLLEGLYNLRLPASIFNQLGIYTIYIKPKVTPILVVDCSVLSALPTVKGIVVNVNDLPDESILMPGDLLFFGTASSSPGPDQFDPISIGHMGIYIGNGKYIHSTSSDSNPERDSKGRGNQFSQPPIAPMEQGAQYGNYNGVKISSLYDSYFSPQLYIMTRRVVKKQESGVYGQAEGLGRTADPGGKSSSPSFNSCHGSTPCHPSLWPGHNAVIGYGTGKGDAVDISTDGKAYAAFDGTATRHSYGKRSDLIGVRLTSKNGQVIAHYVHVKPTKTGEVKAGEVIGTLYPINSPHIHFELQVNGSVVHGNTSLRGSAYVKSLWSNMRKVLGL